ncbi:unnamed protein product [Cyclocybe aegerita]|uniref:Poly(A)+ RNA export protein n=1 Tax=Cyclocybe aegerita TaxID=1973307 RepID=A0A8S0WT55_CYCAE|nr:unnamed protein product [Cyclocybe aegerita]
MSYFSNIANARSMNATLSSAVEKDVELGDPPSDSISSISFSSQANYLAVGSWDNSVRIYEVASNAQSQGKVMYSHQGPVLDVCWSTDGTKVFSSSADNTARAFDIGTGQNVRVGQHDAPIKSLRWVDGPQGGVLVTGSWDKTLKYWDLRTPSAIATVNLPERCYTLDARYPCLVVGCAEQHIMIYDLKNPTVPYKTKISPLKKQLRVVSCFTNSTGDHGFALGGVDGRLAISYIEDKDAVKCYSFKAHRRSTTPTSNDQAIVHCVNSIAFHPVHGTFATGGSDGGVHFWDGEARVRVKTFDPYPTPVSSTAFNKDGSLFAYALSYDWHRGHAGAALTAATNSTGSAEPNRMVNQTKIMLHKCKEEEVRKRQGAIRK